MHRTGFSRLFWFGGTTVLAIALATGSALAQARPFPETRPSSRFQAEIALAGDGTAPLGCLASRIHDLHLAPETASAAARLAVDFLADASIPGAERLRIEGADAEIFFYSGATTFGPTRAGVQEAAAAVGQGLAAARRLVEQDLGLASPGPLAVRVVRIPGPPTGYVIPPLDGRGQPWTVMVEGPGVDPGRLADRVVHQYVHATVIANRLSVGAAWAEALATWVGIRVSETPSGEVLALLEARRERLDAGLDTTDLHLGAGNALWFAFLDEAYGVESLRHVLIELGSGDPVPDALERALAVGTGLGLSEALRDFHLWTILTGERSDGRHFSFAERLASPPFTTVAEWLPAISVRAAPPLASLGATQVLIRPMESDGGMILRLEGDFQGDWEADLLLLRGAETPHRVRLDLSGEGDGEITVPLGETREAVLLIRNLVPADGTPRSYSWAAHHERGFPCDVSATHIAAAGSAEEGVLLSWETESERNLVGFDVIRTSDVGGVSQRLNPIWIPAIGEAIGPASYQFVDLTAEPGATYVYRVEGITYDGLRSRFEVGTLAVPNAGH